ncbi:MAG: PD-(D/E)XK nuclease family protein [Methylophilus sp.]|nr:PD-(D/E)XK nuclease family protein [Methylophilus sp.]
MQNKLILCPTARLVRAIQADIANAQVQAGNTQWQSACILTLTQWLDALTETSLLAGKISNPPLRLSTFNEQLLWEEVISQSLKKNAFGALFNVSGLASAAVEANQYCIAWNLHMPRENLAEETRQFVQWQQVFQKRCQALGMLENVRYTDWQLDHLHIANDLPMQIEFAGFDQTAPQEERLRTLLKQRGIAIADYPNRLATPAHAQHISLENIDAECRAAVAWAKQQLDNNPNTNIAIIAPQLSTVRNLLADLLDDTLTPASARPTLFDCARPYNFSLGTPLIEQPMIQAALNLLRLFSSYRIPQADFSKVLLSPFWSNYQQEVDARAQLDARMREKATAQLSLDSFIVFAKQQFENGLNIAHLIQDLTAATAYVSNKQAAPSFWAHCFTQLLEALQWPGTRNITSLEYQTQKSWQKVLQQLSALDALDAHTSMSEATSLMQQICTQQVFQPETIMATPIQVVGVMEALSAPVDAIWVLQMNDHIWPPPARPNALLPAHIQRAARLPNADNSVQATFAAGIHQRVLHSAKQVIFSSSQLENTTQLRASPLIKNVEAISNLPLVQTLAETLAEIGNADLTHLDDHIAPAVQVGDHVSGGTGLFRAQAICPAWAFYQYRLGAKSLKTPSEGLDNLARGQLVHAVLAAFWQPNDKKLHFADLRDMSDDVLDSHLNKAIRKALQDFAETSNIATKTVLELEHERLQKLVSAWLTFEKEQGISFHIIGCEVEKQVDISGIEVTLKIDRIHQFEDGGMVFVDYKTGQVPKVSTWGEDRIAEPQLPIYASFYFDDASHKIAGLQFGMVKTAEHSFEGVSQDVFDAEPSKRKPKFTQAFNDWQSLLDHFKTSIETIAAEIKAGEASVKFSDENALSYCEVLPLLRLPERQLQFERFLDAVEPPPA